MKTIDMGTRYGLRREYRGDNGEVLYAEYPQGVPRGVVVPSGGRPRRFAALVRTAVVAMVFGVVAIAAIAAAN